MKKKEIRCRVLPEIYAHADLFKQHLSERSGIKAEELVYRVKRRSIDARKNPVVYELLVDVGTREDFSGEDLLYEPGYRDVRHATKVCHIIGAGPAGYFAALECLRQGIKPVVLERGKKIRERRFDIAGIFKKRVVHPHSNYCFGEGGAGTFSDGKLYTRSHKRGSVDEILQTLVFHGASREILVDTHPHIGTNRLPTIIENIRNTILHYGGEIYFDMLVKDFVIRQGVMEKIVCVDLKKNAEEEFLCRYVLLATGHSGREMYELLYEKNIPVYVKPFALGVRVEHPQELIDRIQYHCIAWERNTLRQYLPPASYQMKARYGGRSIYSFCMCPGGIIAPCATAPEELVTNGWSPSKRNNPYANSGMVVEVLPEDWKEYEHKSVLAALEFQKRVEYKAWLAGGENLSAPAVRLTDFLEGKTSTSLPGCSYKPGITPADLRDVLGTAISQCLRQGLKQMGRMARGYITREAVLVAVESRTSSPVRIPRDDRKGHHITIKNLFPCGEGAGYAGGIVSAAMDGVNQIRKMACCYLQNP